MNEKREGLYIFLYANLSFNEGYYKDGKKNGPWIGYLDGYKWEEEHYLGGVRDGLYRIWYSRDRLNVEGNYRDGEEDGEWTYWDENGEIDSIETYVNGMLL